MDNCAGLEVDRLVEALDGVALLLGLVCAANLMAELENEGSLTALEDVVIWTDWISVFNATTDNVSEEVGCKLELLISARLSRTVTDEKVKKLPDKVIVEEDGKIDMEE